MMNVKTDEHSGAAPDGHERISALMDGELRGGESKQAIADLEQDAGLKQTWERYHLIRAALRGNLPTHFEHRISTRVSALLAAEPTVLAPRGMLFKAKLSRYTPALKQVAGLAVAASVTAVAILGVQTSSHDSTAAAPQFAMNAPAVNSLNQAAVSPMYPAEENMLVTAPAPLPSDRARAPGPRWDMDRSAVESKLNRYLANHNHYTKPADVQGVLPYARMVGYDSAK
ncbi:MAG: sigma-E factor negative regulatory protein [Pseudomonadota bacterium]